MFHCRHSAKKTASTTRQISLKSGNWRLSYGRKRFSILRPSAVINFKNVNILSRNCHRVSHLQYGTTFHQNRITLRSYVAMKQFSGCRQSWFFDFFFNLEILSCDLYRHAFLRLHAKFHWNWTIGCRVMAKRPFSIWRPSVMLNFSGSRMGSLKSPCMTCYRPRSVMETHSSKLLRLWENRVLNFDDRQTNRLTNRRTGPLH